MSERSSTTPQSSPATRTLDRRGRLVPVSLAMSLIAFLLHVAFCAESPLINSVFRHSIRNWTLAGPNALPGILLSLLAVPFLKLFPRLRGKWASPIAIALWFGLIIRLATYALPEQHLSSTYSPVQKAAVGPQPESVSRGGSYADQLYRSLSPRFRLNIPDGWKIQKPKGPNIRLLLVSEGRGKGDANLFLDSRQKISRCRSPYPATFLFIANEPRHIALLRCFIIPIAESRPPLHGLVQPVPSTRLRTALFPRRCFGDLSGA
jgi:hypothetical protein